MRRFIFINGFEGPDWPPIATLEREFMDPTRREWAYWDGSGAAGGYMKISGIEGTEAQPDGRTRSGATISIRAHRQFGATLSHHWWDAKSATATTHLSLGDRSLLSQMTTLDDRQPYPIGLFIPFELAWLAFRDFIQEPTRVTSAVPWINGVDLTAQVPGTR